MKIKIYAIGGTIDKVYFDRKNTYQVGDPQVVSILQDSNIDFEFECRAMIHKDSLDMTDADRRKIYDAIAQDPNPMILITHGTDTMIETAKTLLPIRDKTIVLTGSMQPARFKNSDAIFNIGCAVNAVQTLPFGVYITMNGRLFHPQNVRKNAQKNIFETIKQ